MSKEERSRRAFLKGVVAAVAVGAFGVRTMEVAEAMPIVPQSQLGSEPSDLIPTQGGPPHRPMGGHPMGHRGPPRRGPPRRRPPPFRHHRRRVCRRVRGRLVCRWI